MIFSKYIRQYSMSELRGILLVLIGIATLVNYLSWWADAAKWTSPWYILCFVVVFAYAVLQMLGNWLLYLATHHRPQTEHTLNYPFTVDVYVTACGEEYNLVKKCLSAACAMRGNKKVWLLDDGRDLILKQLAEDLGAGYLTRDNRIDAKAGNLNAALSRTNGDIIAIFDIDHVPTPDYLERTVYHFCDSTVGFVQVMVTFRNHNESWIAKAAEETSFDFYNPTSKGMDGLRSATMMGSNALIRRSALEAIGGYRPGLAEDLATSVALHAAGWRSAYVDEPLAPGLAPPDFNAWFTQQFKWARGVFEILLADFPHLFPKLTLGERLSYCVRMTKYWIGPYISLHVLWVVIALFSSNPEVKQDFGSYILHFTPVVLCDTLIRILALRKWGHPTLDSSLLWRPVMLIYFTWPLYTIAWFMALLRMPLAFRPTPKAAAVGLNPLWILPQMLTALLLVIGLIYSLIDTRGAQPILLTAFALAQIAAHLCLFLPTVVPSTKVHSESNIVTQR